MIFLNFGKYNSGKLFNYLFWECFFFGFKKKTEYNIAKKSLMEHQDGLFHVIKTTVVSFPVPQQGNSILYSADRVGRRDTITNGYKFLCYRALGIWTEMIGVRWAVSYSARTLRHE